jgi:hypothetical protein
VRDDRARGFPHTVSEIKTWYAVAWLIASRMRISAGIVFMLSSEWFESESELDGAVDCC